MAAIPLPDRGQPLDISYLLTMANEINKMNSLINVAKVNSAIKYDSSTAVSATRNVATSDLVFYGETKSVKLESAVTEISTTFTYSFKYTPIVTTSVYGTGLTSAITPVITSISNTSCTVTVYQTGTNVGTAKVSIIALGERP